jgi:DNA (cytosine-5)-methyltransferase 1
MKDTKHRYPYEWTLKNANFTKDKGTVFSCFACGGGSTMGYKLAGFDVLGCNEIDPKMMEAYKINHNPKYAYLEPIQTFKLRKNLPEKLYRLDILDGSPPCSSFSQSGSREKAWGKKKKFREGQAEQVLDTLFFDFIDLAKELQPKIVITENVKGILLGNAIKYTRRIYEEFDLAGYYCQHFMLNSAKMGVPQKRERVFFIGLRKDLIKKVPCNNTLFEKYPKLNFNFNEPVIPWGEIIDNSDRTETLPPLDAELWSKMKKTDTKLSQVSLRERGIYSRYNANILYKHKPSYTIMGHDNCVLFDIKRNRNKKELIKCGTFPSDYNFMRNKPAYIIGMSVPPVMMAQIGEEIHSQWLSKL